MKKVIGLLARIKNRKEIDLRNEQLIVALNIVPGSSVIKNLSITGQDHDLILTKTQAVDLIKQLQDHVTSDHMFIEDYEKTRKLESTHGEITDQQSLLKEFLALDEERWSEAGKFDKDDAREYRDSLLFKIKDNVGKYHEIGYLDELQHYIKVLSQKKADKRPLLSWTANDTYLEELEIINECLGL